jgi:integrating conjugative element protein (TIGR03761 family)
MTDKKSPKEPSPFPDGYDIEAEREALADLLVSDEIDTTDPRYSRLEELENREAQLRRMKLNHETRMEADAEVPDWEARGMRDMGRLEDEEADTFFIHTLEAARLFVGKAVAPGENGRGMAGGKKVGASLRTIWYLSGNDNPYADYSLIRTVERMDEMRKRLQETVDSMHTEIDKLKRHGLNFSILKNSTPLKVDLGFKSPYGYSVVILISEFDYFVRLLKTMIRKSLMTDTQGRAKLHEMRHGIRSIFEEVVYYARYLNRDEMRTLSRSDFLPTADADGKKRVLAATKLFGTLPRDIFTGVRAPRHSRRRLDNITERDVQLLNEVPLEDASVDLAALAAA